MRSWAVPKGPSMDPSVKRLAVQVEDHSLAHNELRGHDRARWRDRVGSRHLRAGRAGRRGREALDRGHAVFVLHGEKLRGGFALQRTRAAAKPQWLLIKRRDDEARPGSDVAPSAPSRSSAARRSRNWWQTVSSARAHGERQPDHQQRNCHRRICGEARYKS